MQIDQANPASREAAEKLLLKAGKPHAPKVIPSGGTYPRLEWVLETEKVLANVN
jgi:hypothetical protein